MTSIFNELDALGFLNEIAEIIAKYDGDPFGTRRWKENDVALRERHKKELKEHDDKRGRILEIRNAYFEQQEQKKARERLNMKNPVNDYWSAKQYYNDVRRAYPTGGFMNKNASDLFSKFKKDRSRQIISRLSSICVPDPNHPCIDFETGWVDIARCMADNDENAYHSLRADIQKKCIIKYSGYSESYAYDIPNNLHISDLDQSSVINIPYEKGLISTTIEVFEDMFDTTEIPIKLDNKIWIFDMDDLIDQYFDEDSD